MATQNRNSSKQSALNSDNGDDDDDDDDGYKLTISKVGDLQALFAETINSRLWITRSSVKNTKRGPLHHEAGMKQDAGKPYPERVRRQIKGQMSVSYDVLRSNLMSSICIKLANVRCLCLTFEDLRLLSPFLKMFWYQCYLNLSSLAIYFHCSSVRPSVIWPVVRWILWCVVCLIDWFAFSWLAGVCVCVCVCLIDWLFVCLFDWVFCGLVDFGFSVVGCSLAKWLHCIFWLTVIFVCFCISWHAVCLAGSLSAW